VSERRASGAFTDETLGVRPRSVPTSAQNQETLRQAQDNALHSDIVRNAEMRIGEIRQFCKLREDDQSPMRVAQFIGAQDYGSSGE
jgi:hypothetical protein